MTRRTALVVAVPEAEPLVSGFRQRFDADAVARHIPAHVTVVFPFAEAASVDGELLRSLAELYATLPRFDFVLDRIDHFPEHVWLAPEPRERFCELIDATSSRFPAWPPYEGAFTDVIPHLTIGSGENIDAMTAAARDELGGSLPVPARAETVTLLGERADGTWSERSTFRLGPR